MNKEYSEMQEAGSKELLDITRLIDDAFKGALRYWRVFLVIISISASLFYIREKQNYVPQYQASSTFIVNTHTAVAYSSSYYNNTTAAQLAKTFPYIISNNALQHIIAEDLGVTSIPGTIKATAMADTNLITISVTAYTPENAYNILQSVLKNYPEVARAVIGETELNILDESGMPTWPVNGMNAQYAAKKGFLVGGMICALLLFLYAVTRKTIRREDDLKNVLNVKCYGSVPRVRFKKSSSRDTKQILITNPKVSYGFTEANRTIRTRIERDAEENGSRVYMVSSAVEGEGKSTTAVNLALSLAGKGKKVILVDLDLRNPSVEKTLQMEKDGKGLIDLLHGKAELKDVMKEYQDSGLLVIPGGSPVHMTSRILSNEKTKQLFSDLREMADYVIVDTPPSSILTDASHIVKYMDAGVFVVKQDYAATERILDGIEMLTDTGLRLAGCVLNCAQAGITGYGYGYGYGYGRYGYGKYGKYSKYGKYGSKYIVQSEDEGEK